jgi:hypothetical protein
LSKKDRCSFSRKQQISFFFQNSKAVREIEIDSYRLSKMLKYFMILKLKFNKTVAFHIILHLDPARIFIRGIKKNMLWLCEHSFRPQFLELRIENCEPIVWAARRGHVEIMKWLVSVDPRADKDNAIIRAAGNGHIEAVKWLVSIGANPSAYNDQAIRWAYFHKHLELAKWLYSIGCNPKIRDSYIYRWAAENRHLEVVQWLESIGCEF